MKEQSYTIRSYSWHIDGVTGFTLLAYGDPLELTPVGQAVVETAKEDGKRVLTWYVSSMHVSDEYRRKGVGRLLLERIKHEAIKCEECAAVCLFAKKTNQGAIDLYEKAGFKMCYEWDEEIALSFSLK